MFAGIFIANTASDESFSGNLTAKITNSIL